MPKILLVCRLAAWTNIVPTLWSLSADNGVDGTVRDTREQADACSSSCSMIMNMQTEAGAELMTSISDLTREEDQNSPCALVYSHPKRK